MKAATYEETQATQESKGVFWQLLRLDAVRRSLRWSVPIALVVGLAFRIAAADGLDGARKLPFAVYHSHHILFYIQLWLAVLFAVIIAHFNSRCSSLSLGLPLASRTLWFARVLAVTGAGLIPIAIVVAVTTSADTTRSLGLDMPMLPLGARSAAGFVLAVVLFQLPSPGVHRIAGRKSYVFYVAAVSAAVIAYTVLTPGSWIWTALPVVAALVTGWFVGSRLPAGFNMAGAESKPAKPPAKAVTRTAGEPIAYGRRRTAVGRRWKLLRVIWRENLNTWPVLLMTLLIFLTVWMLTAYYYNVFHRPHEFLTLVLWCWIFVCQSVRRLNRIDYLPVSRGVIFYSVIGFMAAAACLGWLTGYLFDYRLKDSPTPAVCYCDHTVRVPYDAWEIAWDGEAPEISSPWGETHTPYAARVLKHGLELAVYNPFEPGKPCEPGQQPEAGKESSPEFIALQIDRAVARVHSPQEISPRAIDATGDSSFVNGIQRGEYKVPASLRKDSDLRIRTNAVMIMLWFIFFFIVNAVWWKRYQAEAEVKRTRWFAILFFGIPFAVMIGMEILTAKGMLNYRAIIALEMIAFRSVAEAIPLSTALLWTLTVAVAVACVVLLAKQYAKAEAPTPRSGKHLLSEY